MKLRNNELLILFNNYEQCSEEFKTNLDDLQLEGLQLDKITNKEAIKDIFILIVETELCGVIDEVKDELFTSYLRLIGSIGVYRSVVRLLSDEQSILENNIKYNLPEVIKWDDISEQLWWDLETDSDFIIDEENETFTKEAK